MRLPQHARVALAARTATSAVADGIGFVGVAVGTLLVASPGSGGRWLRLDATSIRRRRALGLVDLTLGIAILRARRTRAQRLPLAAHSAMHVPYALEYLRGERPIGAAIMGALLVVDAAIAVAARRHCRDGARRADGT